MIRSDSYDAVVIGAGPAGSAAAAVLAREGRQALLLEREPEPRFKIGESLMPETYWTLQRMGAWDRLQQSHFVKKYSVQFYTKNGKASAPFYFRDEIDHPRAQTWQVLRSEFDQLLFETAAEQGAECHRGVAVREILTAGERVTGVRVTLPDGSKREIAARAVIDATGQSTLLAKKFDLGKVDYGLRNASIFTHFRGAWRDQGIDEGATLILHTRAAESWFWYIPLPNDLMSVGVVGGVDYLVGGREGTPEQIFWEEVGRCGEIESRLEKAERVRPFGVIRDFSYRYERVAGEGWVLIGDAFSFIDPVYSSGVFLALKTGEMAADAVLDGLAHDDLSEVRLGAFRPELMAGIEALRTLVDSFYDKEFSIGRFVKQYPHHQGSVTRILIGDVFDRDFGPLFADMAAMRRELRSPVGVADSGS